MPWTEPVMVAEDCGGSLWSSYPTETERTRNIVIDGNGVYWVTYVRRLQINGTNTSDIFVAYSTDGASWVEERITEVTERQRYSCIAIDSNNDIHLAWVGQGWGVNSAVNNVQYRKRTSGGWQTQESVTDHTSGQGDPVMVVDDADDVHVVFVGAGWGTYTNAENLHYRKRTSSGWGTIEHLTDSVQSDYYPTICVAPNFDVYIVAYIWIDRSRPYYYQRTLGSWSAGTPVYIHDKGSYYHTITVDQNNNVHYVFSCEDDDWDLQLYYTENWGTIEQLTHSDGEDQVNPYLEYDKNNNLFLAWSGMGWDHSRYSLMYNERIGGTWQAQRSLFSDWRDQWAPSIFIDDKGNIGVVWTYYIPTGTLFHVYFMSYISQIKYRYMKALPGGTFSYF